MKQLCPSIVTGILFAASAAALQANPTGGNVTAGSASIAGQGTSTVTVNQASKTAIINWQTFSINSGEQTQFLQPSATSAVLNRVLGGQTSLINGTLSANGQVYLVNGNGIVIGPGGVVNANAFTASTRDISDADFLAGNLHFTGSNDAGVQNLGTINALGGNVVLIGKTVDNQGTINALNGTAGLVAGDDVLLGQKNADGSTITVNPTALPSSASGQVGVHNSGTITAAAAELKAANGNIYALAIQNEGTIRATTLQKQGGHIWLTSDSGSIVNSGTLNASATAAKGKGGSIVVKSTKGSVSHTGTIIAQGGQGGVGGNVDLSGLTLQFSGTVDLSAPGGALGNLLLDPTDMEIVNGGGSILTGSTVDPSAIVAALENANVTLQADNSITVTDIIDASGNANTGNLTLDTLTLNLNAGITLNGTLSGTATTVNVGANGFIQNGVDAAASGATVNLAATTYFLNSEVLINKDLTLNGQGASSTILDGQQNTRVMEIDGTGSGVNVTLNGLTLQNGYVYSDNGGGLLINASNGLNATVTIENSVLTGNEANASYDYDNYVPVGGMGGAIYSNAENGGTTKLTIDNSTISNNTVDGDQGGIGGGGIFNDGQNSGSATLIIKNSSISGNYAYGSDGGVGVFSIADYGGTTSVTISGSTISNNVGDEGTGGGIYNDGQESGNATLTITNSTISGNSLEDGLGGGIFNIGSDGSAPMTITNSTIANNVAAIYGAIDDDGYMGSATTTIANSTIVGNSSQLFGTGGILNDAAVITISNTILADNTTGTSPTVVESDYETFGGTLNSLGYNLYGQSGDNGGFTGVATDIQLGGPISSVLATDVDGNPLLANNGGYTQTIALVSGSVAIDAGNPSSTLTTDQRGAQRGGAGGGLNAGGRIDIGAYEATSSYVVTNALDDNSVGSLRSAISFGNAASNPDFNANPANATSAIPQITFDPTVFATAQTIDLENGELLLTGSMTITGSSAGVIINAQGNSRVMEIDGTATGDTVNLTGLTLENGNDQSVVFNIGIPTSTGVGGGLFIDAENGSKATVSISDSIISGNSVNANGGGIDNDGSGGNATLTISNSTITGNSASSVGGGIYNNGRNGNATLTITNSTISGNSTDRGGGIYNNGGNGNATLTIANSTFSGNLASDGGGIYNNGDFGSAALTITNSTISGNSAGDDGGGILNFGNSATTTATITDSTISGNSAVSSGGGILNEGQGGTITMTIGNTILAGNTIAGGESDYASGEGVLTDNGYNLFATGGGITGNGTTDVMVASIGNTGDIRLVLAGTESGSGATLVFTPDLANNGGPTQTIALVAGSPAIAAGGTNSGYELDQRGYVRSTTGDISIGAYEANSLGNPFVVTTNVDPATGNLFGSLRTALNYSNANPFLDPTITFDPSDFSSKQTIQLGAQGELVIDSSLTIDGSSAGVTINGNTKSREIEIDGTSAGVTVTLDNLTLEGGTGDDGITMGGATNGFGGALLVYATSGQTANVTINDSTITGNGTISGGAIGNESVGGVALLTINNSTISGNAAAYGGAIANFSAGGVALVTINNSTVTGNFAAVSGGGIYNNASSGTATVVIGDTILAGNSLNGVESDYSSAGGILTDNGFNLFATGGGLTSNGTTDVTVAALGNAGDINSVLAGTESTSEGVLIFVPTLADNGGPTQTIAQIVGSSAYLAGGPLGSVTTDQRGDARGSVISIGAWDYNPADLSLVVNTNTDPADDVIGSTPVSLRDAIFYGDAGGAAGFFTNPTITFDADVFTGGSANVIALSQGELLINSSLTIDASAVSGLTINANNASRVMEIDGTTAGDTVNLSNLTLENGNGIGANRAGQGGGLLIDVENGQMATVTINSSTLSDNSAGNDGNGGGIFNIGNGGSATLTINNSTLSGNSANGGKGGGIYSIGNGGSATLTINNSTLSGNSANGGKGGGIYNIGNGGTATATITDSTLSGNSADEGGNGGGIYNIGNGGTATVTIDNSTLSGNSADGGGQGGGIYNMGNGGTATVTIDNSTLSGNSADGGGQGGGIYNIGNGGIATLVIGDTILAGNSVDGAESDYVSNDGTVTDSDYNLYGQNGDDGGFNSSNGVTVQPNDLLLGGNINTVLTPLGNYGGPTQTMALVVGSPAYLQGGPIGSVTTDQRGDTRGSMISIGAWDYDPSQLTSSSTVVTTNADPVDVIGSAVPVSLRDAIYYAEVGGFPTVTFNTNPLDGTDFSTAQTITLAQGELSILLPLDIEAPSGNTVTVSGNNSTDIFDIFAGTTLTPVTLDHLTITDGNGAAGGGVVFVDSVAVINNCTITGNTALGAGGGILAFGTNLTVNNSTISGNTVGTDGTGGGIYFTDEGTLTINNSTISGNSIAGMTGSGGGITLDAEAGELTLIVTNSTISGNSAGQGGGIYNSFGNLNTLTITGSTISGNQADNGGGIYSAGEVSGTGIGYTLAITGSTISGNSASSDGGGIYSDAGNVGAGVTALTITNSTITGNSAGSDGGGIYNTLQLGGGSTAVTDTLTITNSTITGNSAASVGGGIWIDNSRPGNENTTTLTISGTILAANSANGAESDYVNQSGSTVDNGYNLYGQNGDDGGFNISNEVTITPTDILLNGGINTVLGPLANNGGPTQTMALVAGSLAIDAGDPAAIGTADQRGVIRGDGGFTGTASDIGAYEAQVIDVTAGDSITTYGVAPSALTYTVTNGDATGLLSGSLAFITPETNAGTYTGDVGQGTLAATSPYLIDFTAGTLVINQATLVISAVTDTKTYDGTISSTQTPIIVSGLVTGDCVTGLSQSFESKNVLGTDGSTLSVNDGYTVHDGNGGNNYTVELETAAGTINPATLTYQATPVSIHLSQPIPPVTGTVTGFVNGETLADATTGPLTFTTTAKAASMPGSYAINGSGLVADNGNYVFVQASGNATALTIGGYLFGQPGNPFSNFSAQFNANANYNTFFTQSWFPLFDGSQAGWLIPVFSPGNEPHPVYSNRPPGYEGKEKKPAHVIGFGSSYQILSQTGAY